MTSAHEDTIRLLGAAYSTQPMPDLQVAAYLSAVEDLDPDDVLAAVLELIKTAGRFLPRPSEVRQAVARLIDGDEPDPGLAWREVVAEIGRVGRDGHPDFTNPLTGDAVKAIGGWTALCNSTNPTADRAQFLRAFERLAERDQRERLVACGLGRGVMAALPQQLSHELPEGDDD